MTSKQRQKWEQAIQVASMITEGLGTGNRFDLAHDVAELMSLANRLDHYNETECNYGLTPTQQTRVANLEKRVTATCKRLGITCHFNGDPRGYAVRLHLPKEQYNTWGGKEEGWGISVVWAVRPTL